MLYARLSIPATLYAACSAAVSTDPARPHIHGLCLARDPFDPAYATVCATDGMALVAGRWRIDPDDIWSDGECVVPPVRLSAVGITPRAVDTSTVVLTSHVENPATWTVSAVGRYGATGRTVTVQSDPDREYPRWRQVVPCKDAQEVTRITLDPAIIARATDLLGPCTFYFSGPERAIVARPTSADLLDYGVFALVMPKHLDPDAPLLTGVPTWVHGAPPVDASSTPDAA